MGLSSFGTAYLAPKGYTHQLIKELKGIQHIHGRLIFTNLPPQPSNWALNLWKNPTYFKSVRWDHIRLLLRYRDQTFQ